jgi:hypothetical protein
MSFRIESISAFISIGSDDEEGIIGAPIGPQGEVIPLIAADEARLLSLMPLATRIASVQGIRIKLIRFTHREEVGDIPGNEAKAANDDC